MKTLLTGPTGFVGQNLSPYLVENGFEVLPFSLRGNWLSRFPEEYASIIHLAGKAHDTKNATDEQVYFDVNTELTKALFDLFLESDARDFIYLSSVKAVTDTAEAVLDESAIPHPKTPYGKSKLHAEAYLTARDLPAGKRLFILRPCMIHGPGNKGNLNLLYRMVSKGIPYPLAAYENRRSFLSIENLLFAVKWLLKNRDIAGGIYHIADDETLSTNELIKLMGEARNENVRLWRLSPSIIKGLSRVGDVFRLPLNSERLGKLTENYVVSNEKIKSALKIEKFPVTARDGLVKTLRTFG